MKEFKKAYKSHKRDMLRKECQIIIEDPSRCNQSVLCARINIREKYFLREAYDACYKNNLYGKILKITVYENNKVIFEQ